MIRLPLFVALGAVFVIGCSGTPRPDDALTKTQPALDLVDARLASANDVRILTKADYWDMDEGKRVVGRDVSISALAPASLRVTLSSFDKAMASLASDGTDFSMLDVQKNVYYHGPATPENLSKLLPIFLSGEDFVRVLRGGFPIDGLADDWQSSLELGWNGDTAQYRLEIPRRDGGLQVVELTYPDLAVALIHIEDANGKKAYSYKGKDFEMIDGIPVPGMSRFEQVADEIEVTLRIESFEVNVEPNPRIFHIKPPAGSEQVYLGP